MPPGIDISAAPELAPPTFVTTQARAVFTPDDNPDGTLPTSNFNPDNMQLSLHSSSRRGLVEKMAAGDGWIDAEHLVLSALGCDASFSYISQQSFTDMVAAHLKSNGKGNGILAGPSIWKHRIVVGRDVFFLEAFAGFLFPHGLPAFYVELTKRRFAEYTNDGDKTTTV